ncbi:hypothetical protein KNT87_gp093 [Erwinia phage Cronus]|uniref:Uncharacterized protein n=1 Tax=Erwinia phage Cronus TaxID=2163633 RepID=A0A2S1GMB8_9CAUD|nr:hypothetical protein KNT87_gp093 [Erwinia phage Cronus]AWD90532.1 hypothetical protein [Erwinia phage Cronus]
MKVNELRVAINKEHDFLLKTFSKFVADEFVKDHNKILSKVIKGKNLNAEDLMKISHLQKK